MTTPWHQWLAALPRTLSNVPGLSPVRRPPDDAASLIARQIKRETNKPDVPPEDAA
jgi:hypothetical protein